MARQNTYTRIIEAGLLLFNEEGERNISTNHIAAHLGISPGNLYYHFRNKDEIIVQLYRQYGERMVKCLQEAEAAHNIHDMANYFSHIFDVMWDYRFLFSGVNTLLARSEELVGEHNEFTQAILSPLTLKIMLQLMEAGILKGSQQDMHDLCLNIWLVTRYWFDFDAAMRGQGKLLPDSKKLGVLRNFSLIRPYVAEAHLAEFHEVIARLQTEKVAK